MTDSPNYSTNSTQAHSDSPPTKPSKISIIANGPQKNRPRRHRHRCTCLLCWFCTLSVVFLGTTLAAVLAWAVFTDGFKDYRRSRMSRTTNMHTTEYIITSPTTQTEAPAQDTTQNSPNPMCTTPDCIRIAAEMMEFMDWSIDPCDDFYQYACAKYETQLNVPDMSFRSKIQDMTDNSWQVLQVLLEDETPEEDSESDRFIKTFYQDCKNYTARTNEGAGGLMDTLRELGIEPMLETGNGGNRGNVTSIESLLGRLSKRFTLPLMLLPVYIVVNPMLFEIKKPYSLMVSLDNPLAGYAPGFETQYKYYAIQFLQILGITGNTENMMDEIIDFERDIANIQMMETGDKMQSDVYNTNTTMDLDVIDNNTMKWNRTGNMVPQLNVSVVRLKRDVTVKNQDSELNISVADQNNPLNASTFMNLTVDSLNVNQTDNSNWNASIPMSDGKSLNETLPTYNNYMTIADLYNLTQPFDWYSYLDELVPGEWSQKDMIWLGYPGDSAQQMSMYSMIFQKLATLMQNTDSRIVINYLFFKTMWDFSDHLPMEMQRPKQIYSQTANLPYVSSIDCIGIVRDQLSTQLSSLFVREYFPNTARDKIDELVRDIRSVMDTRLQETTWFDDVSTRLALQKLSDMKQRVGAPKDIKNGSLENPAKLQSRKGKFLENALVIMEMRNSDELGLLKLDDADEDWIPAYLVNAFYEQDTNTINFPAGILVYPQFLAEVPKFFNYGRIGQIIGHEITHAFDRTGAMGDGIVNWWTEQTSRMFDQRSQCLAQQYDELQFSRVSQFNGNRTLPEDIADNGGLRIAYEAYLLSQGNGSAQEDQSLPGFQQFTSNQMFFIAFATNYCEKLGDSYASEKWNYDIHSDGRNRVNVPLSNSEYFAAAFQCALGSKMNRKDKCIVW